VSQAEDHLRDVPESIADLCQALTDFVHQATGFRPDYSPLTLPIVDHYLRLNRDQIVTRNELVDLTSQAVGAYFGEVVRRALTGLWHVPSPNFNDWALLGQVAFVSFNPIGVGYEMVLARATYEGPSSQIKVAKDDAELVLARLAALPPEREDDYYTLAVRFEALEVITECVRAQAEARGYSDMSYSAEDYAHSVPFGLPRA
jgi:hypothetical protein